MCIRDRACILSEYGLKDEEKKKKKIVQEVSYNRICEDTIAIDFKRVYNNLSRNCCFFISNVFDMFSDSEHFGNVTSGTHLPYCTQSVEFGHTV